MASAIAMPCSGSPDGERLVAPRVSRPSTWRHVALAVALTAAWLGAGRAHGQSRSPHRAGVDVAVGGDSNPTLAASPRSRARMDTTVLPPSATVSVDVWTRLTAHERARSRLLLNPYLTAQGFSGGGAYLDLGLDVAARFQHRALSLDVGGNFGGYAATFALDNSVYGDLSLGAHVTVNAVEVGAIGYARFRSYTQDQLDGVFGARAFVRADHERWRWEAQLGGDARHSNEPTAGRAELYVGLEASGVEGPWEWLASTMVYSRWFASAPRDGREWVLRGRLDRAINPRVSMFLAVEAGRAVRVRGNDEGLLYGRGALEVGVRVRLHAVTTPVENDSAERVASGRYRFMLHAPDAEEVVLLADFLSWDESRGALTRTADGYFEGTFDVPTGRHRYRMLVDGVLVTPPARAYADDGFGGRDAVLNVE